MIVVDASAAVDLVLRNQLAPWAAEHLLDDSASLHAPQLIDVEVLGALRRHEQRGELAAPRAQAGLDLFRDLPLRLYRMRPLLARAWARRANFTIGDALYVALAESLGAALVTTDARSARAIRQLTPVEVISP